MKVKILLSIIAIAISCNCLLAQNWTELNQVISQHRDSLGEFGRFVDISDNYAIVGANYETTDTNDLNPIYAAGTAYIFEKVNNNWKFAQKLVSSDRSAGDYFGYAVAIHGDIAVVGSACQDKDEAGNNHIVNAGAVYIFERNSNGNWVEIQKICSNDRNFEDWFGDVVDVSEDYILVGARGDDYDDQNANFIDWAGAAYFFKKDASGTWVQDKKVVAPDRTKHAGFGSAVSIVKDRAVIGAPNDSLDALGTNHIAGSGSAYFYQLDAYGNWTQTKKVTASDREVEANFGCSVSIFGDHAVVGAWHQGSGGWSYPMNPLYMAGAAYVFEINSESVWNQTQKLTASTRRPMDCFGKSVSISHNTIVVACHGDDYGSTGNSYLPNGGAAYVFNKDNLGTWNQTQILTPANRQTQDVFGSQVSIFENDIIVGALGRDLDTNNLNFIDRSGAAYFFEGCFAFSDTTAVVCDDHFIWNGTLYNSSSSPFITYPNTGGCDSIVTLHLTLIGNNVIVQKDSLSPGTVKLTAPASTSYQWLDCNNAYAIIPGEINQSYIASTNGSYAVEVIRNGCIDTSACYFHNIGIHKNNTSENINLYPNPTTGSFIIDLGAEYEDINIRIRDITGRILKENSFSKHQSIQMDIQQVPGVYLVEVRLAEKIYVYKIIKE